MIIIHIHESTECAEVHAQTVEKAVFTYLHYTAWSAYSACDFEEVRFDYPRNSSVPAKVTVFYNDGTLTLTQVAPCVYVAEWRKG